MHHPSPSNTMTDRLQLQDGLERLSKRSLGQQSQRHHHHHDAADAKEATQERRKRIDQLRSSLQVPLSPLPQNTHADLNSDDEESLDGSISSWMDKSRKLFGRTSSKSKADLDGSSSSLFGAKSLFSFGSGNKSGGTLETAPEDVSECSLEEDLFDRQDNNNNNTSKNNSFNNSFLGKYIVQKKPTQAAQEDIDRSEKVRRREAAQELLAGKTQELAVETAPRPRREETHSRRSHRPSRVRAGSDDVDASMRRRRHRRGTKEPSPEGQSANRRRRGSMEAPARRREDERAARTRRRRSSIGAAEPPKLAAMHREESSRRRMKRGSVTGSSPTARDEPRTPRSTVVRRSAVAPSSPRGAAARRQGRRSSQVEGSTSEDQRRTKHLPARQRTR